MMVKNTCINIQQIVNSINCITGWVDYLLDHLHESFRKAQSIDTIVALLRESGAALIVKDLVKAQKLRVRTGLMSTVRTYGIITAY